MKRLFKVIPLCAAALLFTAAVPGLAEAGHGGHGKGGHRASKHFDHGRGGGKHFKHRHGHKKHFRHGHDHGKHFKHRRHHNYGHWRKHGYKYGHRHHRHRHHYGHRRHYYGYYPYYPYYPYFGSHRYPGYGYRSGATAAPPAYQVQPQATYAQPAVIKDAPQSEAAPSSCLMTREYQTEIVVGGEVVPGYGQACLQPDGSWQRGPAVPEQY